LVLFLERVLLFGYFWREGPTFLFFLEGGLTFWLFGERVSLFGSFWREVSPFVQASMDYDPPTSHFLLSLGGTHHHTQVFSIVMKSHKHFLGGWAGIEL
jgi:hypothetical protein